MDTYNIVLGDGDQGKRGVLYGQLVLNLPLESFGRFRDAWVEVDEQGVLRIAIYTRNGGGNRADWVAVTEALRQHPCYLLDKDDTFDTTYATYYFRFPVLIPDHLANASDAPPDAVAKWDHFTESVRKHAHPGPIDTDKRWLDALDKMDKEGPTEEQMEQLKPVAQAIKDVMDGPQDPDGAVPIIRMDGSVEYHLHKQPEEGSE